MLSRFLFNNAMEHAHAHNEFAPYATANLLQDALEIFLLAAAEKMNAKIEKRTDFVTYLDKIDEKLTPSNLPFRLRLIQLNKLRVAAKHDALPPDAKEIETLVTVVQEFLREATQLIFRVDFTSINLISLVENKTIRDLLTEADESYQRRDFAATLIACRKAFFTEFEKRFDIKPLEKEASTQFFGLITEAPLHARSIDYINNFVRSPFDYIVLDFTKIDNNLIKERIDPVVFWNIWRLTPAVYVDSDGNWLVKHDLEKLEGDIEQNATYVLENIIEILIRRQERNKSSRYARNGLNFVLAVKTKNARIFKKADGHSEIHARLPDDATEVNVAARVPSLRTDESPFWEITYLKNGGFLMGYMSEDDLDLNSPPPSPPEPSLTDKQLKDAIFGPPKKRKTITKQG